MAVPTAEAVSNSVERHLGVEVHAIERQPRWRPCWFVDAERNGEPLRIVVRGERIVAVGSDSEVMETLVGGRTVFSAP